MSEKQNQNINNSKQTQKPQTDSNTFDVKQVVRFTSRLTVRCDPEVKKQVLSFCQKTGLSLCQLTDILYRALLTLPDIQKTLDVKSPTINLTVERVVRRPRRYLREEFEEEHVFRESRVLSYEGGGGGLWVDFYDGEATVWKRVRVESADEVNVNGHAGGCQCLLCRHGCE